MVWVNRDISSAISPIAVNLFNLLSGPIPEFMTFDTTIIAVRISHLMIAFTSAAVSEIRTWSCAILLANENIDGADIIDRPGVSSEGPAWLWHGQVNLLVPGAATVQLNMVDNVTSGLWIKANRRLREDNMGLFLISDPDMNAGDTDVELRAFTRTLLRIP